MNNASGKPGTRQVSVYLVIFLLSAGWVVTLGWFSTTYQEQLAASRDHTHSAIELRHSLREIQTRITEFERHLHNQTALVARLTGDIIPIQLPADAEMRLARLEGIVETKAHWPTSVEEADDFLREVREIISQLPSWAEAHYLEQLVGLRWTALVFQQVHAGDIAQGSTNKEGLLEQIETDFNTLIELVAIAPSNHSPAVMERLEKHIEFRQENDAKRIKELAIAQARAAQDDEATPETMLLRASLWLDRIPSQDQEIESLQIQLQQRMKILEARQFTQQARLRHDRLKQTAAGNPGLLGQGEQLLLNEIGTRQALLAFDGMALQELDALREQIEAAILDAQTRAHNDRLSAEEARQREALRAYQVWALSKLREFENLYNVRQLRSRSWTPAATRTFRHALVELLKVDARFLDWALAETFHSTLQAGSQLILETGSEAQMGHFINQSVEVKKVGLHEISDRQ